MQWRFVFLVGVLLGAAILPPTTAYAADSTNKGLSISPLRQEVTAKPGAPKVGFFTVANYTEKPMTIDLSVQQFSVTDYVYDYKFLTPPKYNWVKLRETTVVVQPSKSQKIYYDVTVPAKTTPGGYYFSLFASTEISGPGLPGKVQAATLLYLVVDGKLVRTSELKNDSIPLVVAGSEVPYKFDVKNTGNMHFSAYFYGQVENLLFGKGQEFGTSHILMPGAIRTVSGAVPTPFWPGVYKVHYGYRVDFAAFETVKTAYVIFLPPWLAIVCIFLLIGGRWQMRRMRKDKKVDQESII
jgi:hypothetical protein